MKRVIKTCIFLFVGLLFTIYACGQKGKTAHNSNSESLPLNIIGKYEYWINSMCVQNCEGYSLAGYDLIELLSIGEPQMGEEVICWAKGELKEVEGLATVAGPQADNSMIDKKIMVTKFQASASEKLKFGFTQITTNNKAKFERGEDFEAEFSFKNPFEMDINFTVMFNEDQKYDVTLKQDENKEMSFKIKGGSSYINYRISNFAHIEGDYYENKSNAAKSGLIIDVRGLLSTY